MQWQKQQQQQQHSYGNTSRNIRRTLTMYCATDVSCMVFGVCCLWSYFVARNCKQKCMVNRDSQNRPSSLWQNWPIVEYGILRRLVVPWNSHENEDVNVYHVGIGIRIILREWRGIGILLSLKIPVWYILRPLHTGYSVAIFWLWIVFV